MMEKSKFRIGEIIIVKQNAPPAFYGIMKDHITKYKKNPMVVHRVNEESVLAEDFIFPIKYIQHYGKFEQHKQRMLDA